MIVGTRPTGEKCYALELLRQHTSWFQIGLSNELSPTRQSIPVAMEIFWLVHQHCSLPHGVSLCGLRCPNALEWGSQSLSDRQDSLSSSFNRMRNTSSPLRRGRNLASRLWICIDVLVFVEAYKYDTNLEGYPQCLPGYYSQSLNSHTLLQCRSRTFLSSLR